MGFQVGFVYEMNGRFMVCAMMDFQTFTVQFKIFRTLEEAMQYGKP